MEKLNIVIVDDQPMHLIVLSSYFDADQYQVFSYETPELALSYAQKNHADIYLVDYFMPGMNGVECIQEIKKLDQTSICLLYTGEQVQTSIYVDKIIEKPIVKAKLLEIIADLVNKY